MPRELPFPGSQIRSTVLRHVNTPSLASVARSGLFPEAKEERDERVKAYYESSPTRRKFERAFRRAWQGLNGHEHNHLESQGADFYAPPLQYSAQFRHPDPNHRAIQNRMRHEHYKHGAEIDVGGNETVQYDPVPGYRNAYRANKAARAHLRLPRRFMSSEEHQEIRG